MIQEECPVCKRNGSSDTCHVCGGGNVVCKKRVDNTAIWKYWMVDMEDGRVIRGGVYDEQNTGKVGVERYQESRGVAPPG